MAKNSTKGTELGNEGVSGALDVSKERENLLDDLLEVACKATGTRYEDIADRVIVQASNALVRPREKDATKSLIKGIRTLDELSPQNLLEAILAAQIIAVNDAAHLFWREQLLKISQANS